MIDLAVDASDDSAWIVSSQELMHLTPSGVSLELLYLRGASNPARSRVLSIYTDTAPPVLTLLEPSPGFYSNTGAVELHVSYEDIGSGVDTDSLSFELDEAPVSVSCTHDVESARCNLDAPLQDGNFTVRATLTDRLGNATTTDLLPFAVDTVAPQIEIQRPAHGAVLNSSTVVLEGQASDETSGLHQVRVGGDVVGLDVDNKFSRAIALEQEGANTFEVSAMDLAGNEAIVSVSVIRDTIAPRPLQTDKVTVIYADGLSTLTGEPGAAESGALLQIKNTRTGEIVQARVGPDGSFIAVIASQPGDVFEVKVVDEAGNESESSPLASGGLPPDPAAVAPAIDPTVATTIFESTKFLYTGATRVQTGIAPEIIERRRAAVLRGLVMNKDNDPLAGVKVSIQGHPEYGETLTRTDGMFDLAVNGGGKLTINYEKDQFFAVQRKVDVPWNDFSWANDVVMIKADPAVTTVSLSSGSMQVARGSSVTDTDGTRKATLLFPAGTTSTMTLADGTQQALTTINVRATEYTVGENGPKTMPGELPTYSGYTYALELSVDEAMAAGAARVDFNQAVPFYVENFLGFPVGEVVPAGWYDRAKSAWVASQNGRIIKILSNSGGTVELDVDGSGVAADPAALAELGITDEERIQIAGLYSSGDELWRVPITHFTPWDCNFPYGPPLGASGPKLDTPILPESGKNISDCNNSTQPGCTILAQNQVLGEEIELTGTPFTLNYRSDRVPGWHTQSTLNIPVSGETVPESLKKIVVTVAVGGYRFVREYSPLPNQSWQFEWDGRDLYGRYITGPMSTRVTISYEYDLVYYAARADMERSFALAAAATVGGSPRIIGNRWTSTIGIAREWTLKLYGGASPRIPQFISQGAWSLGVHHAYDPVDRALHAGTGTTVGAGDISRVIERFDLPEYFQVSSVVGRSDGAVLVADIGSYRVWEMSADGTWRVVAGSGGAGFAGDGGPAADAKLNYPADLAVSSDGRIYIADQYNNRIRMIATDGTISTVAGSGASGYAGDGGFATSAQLQSPRALAVAPDGTLFIADTGNNVVRRVGTDSIITTVAGTGTAGYDGDGKLATTARLSGPSGIAVTSSGDLLIADTNNNRVRLVSRDGVITTIAGTGTGGVAGDGGTAVSAQLYAPVDVEVANDGSIYVSDSANERVRVVSPDGTIDTLAGNGTSGVVRLRGPAEDSPLQYPGSVGVGADGSVYILSNLNPYRIAPPWPGLANGDMLIAGGDNELYHFDKHGRHLRTLDTITGAVIWLFKYDTTGALASIDDGDGNITTIERGVDGTPTAIIGPDGQRTDLVVDENGYLVAEINPAGEMTTMQYSTSGLLSEFTEPKGFTDKFTYNSAGRLIANVRPDGGGWTIDRTVKPDGYSTVSMTSGEGRVTTYETEPLAGRYSWYWPTAELFTTTHPDGTTDTRQSYLSSYTYTTTRDGTRITSNISPDPRFGMTAPKAGYQVVLSPNWLHHDVEHDYTAVLTTPGDLLSHERLEEITRVNGRTYSKVYETAARTWTQTSPEGRTSTKVLDARGRVQSQETSGLAPFFFSYDERGRLSNITQGNGAEARTTTLAYHDVGAQAGWLAEVIDALGRNVQWEYDAAGRVTRQKYADGREVQFSYDANGNLISIVPPGRSAHVFDYTSVDLESEYNPPDVGLASDVTRYAYNLDKQLTTITRPSGEVVQFIYDTGGRVKKIDFPTGSVSHDYLPDTGQLSTSTTADGVGLSFGYDGFLKTSERLSGTVSGFIGIGYDANFWIYSIAVNSDAILYQYDNDGLLSRAGNLNVQRDVQSGLITRTILDQVVDTRAHNGFGELQSVEYPGVPGSIVLSVDQISVTADTLDVSGLVADAGRVAVNGIDMAVDVDGAVSGQIPLVLGSNSVTVEVFDRAGTSTATQSTYVERAVPAGNNIFQMLEITSSGDLYYEDDSHAAWRLLAGSGAPDQPAWLSGASDISVDSAGSPYLLKGTVLSKVEGGVESIVVDLAAYAPIRDMEVGPDDSVYFYASPTSGSGIFRVDPALGTVAFHSALPEDVTAIRLGPSILTLASISVFDPDTAVKLDSSTWGLVVQRSAAFYKVETNGAVNEYFRYGSFDVRPGLAVDRTGQVCYLAGLETARIFCRSVSGTTSEVNGYGYSVLGLGFDGSNKLHVGTNENVYRDDAGVLTALIVDTGAAEIRGTLHIEGDAGKGLYSAEYTRDLLGRIVQKTEIVQSNSHVYDYVYDLAGRLIEVRRDGAVQSTYTYDLNGNRLFHNGSSATYDGQDRLVSYDGASYAYTDNGELTSKTDSTGRTEYTYDALGNLRQVIQPDGAQIDYVIDPRNCRVGKKVNGVLVQGLLYKDQLSPVAELDGDGNVVSTFVYGTKANVPDYMIKGGTTYRIVSDHLGSPRLVVNAATKAVVQRIDYDEFGRVLNDTNPGFQPFGFAGGLYDPDTQLVRFGARDYDAHTGRWTAKDPIGFGGGEPNLYGYSINDPVNYLDSNGLMKDSITVRVEAAIARGDTATLRNLIDAGALNPAQRALAQQGLHNLSVLRSSTSNIGELANVFNRTGRQIKDAIHSCKNKMARSGSERNPDVVVDKATGEVYPKLKDGGFGDSIGNIFDHLH